MPTISVTKCHGTGNDFILLDARALPELAYDRLARFACRRRFSLGADGLLLILDPSGSQADAAMRIFNADGSEAEMCGNGIRCVARYLYERGPTQTERRIETRAGVMQTRVVSWAGGPGVSVVMGEPRFRGPAAGNLERSLTKGDERAPAYGVSMGNPHVVVFVPRDLARYDLADAAREVASWGVWDAEPNVELVRLADDSIQMRVHERGVGETWACGTGACATAAAAMASGRSATPVTIASKGGSVRVAWEGPGHPAVLTGDAVLVLRTELELPDDVVAVAPEPAGGGETTISRAGR